MIGAYELRLRGFINVPHLKRTCTRLHTAYRRRLKRSITVWLDPPPPPAIDGARLLLRVNSIPGSALDESIPELCGPLTAARRLVATDVPQRRFSLTNYTGARYKYFS